ncbi:hypothetical protein M2459_002579 [Parabacteroides sp. PF5-5]|uniref:DNA alkylation repair protein n=1 Tax=unclassified Parabacteroides TaxID=2649774 RepID=UPI00247411F8|nr:MULTISPECIES: DNA alkylation repair protein [unclassified Parabacteroides]MDH6305665.1 hypothetical protein [Parabacteroides sp. PH5-39]MDH6316737.1 hypothetical protein [Parabacteroides sp. PF5-13]MDH6320378.1 hypothetical protein [Parabacteroides sp. PH5-13]MDH6324108.1 hypothetical protein [Parabacteroides sp. PH5-8]MDH6327923.1 hypothetical protein [Parabacteroides sp. PH5-41]
MKDTIRDIRSRLRLSMNGVVSTSMREQGLDYKLNFGVSLPKIKEIAASYPPDAALAELLWKEDVRELKILATLLQPVSSFKQEQAERWTGEVRHQEIAEQYAMNLLQHLPFAEELAAAWIMRKEEYVPVVGFLLYARLCVAGASLERLHAEALIREARKAMDGGVSRLQRAALLALKRYGRQSAGQAKAVLESIADYASSDFPERQEFLNDLKFEFEYYH